MNWWEFHEELPAQTSGVAPSVCGPERDAIGALSTVKPAQLVKTRADRIADIEEELHEEAATILKDAMHFMDVEPGPLDPETGERLPPQPPAAWVAELGEEGAKRRLRTAQHALSSSKDAPVGLKLAKDALVGMAKVKAVKNAPARTLNMIVVNMTAVLPEFEELEVDR